MGIFTRKTVTRHCEQAQGHGRSENRYQVRIELDDETRQSLVALENDLQVVEGFLRDVVLQGRQILSALQGDAIRLDTQGEPETGVQPFADEPLPTGRVRMSPFNRRPRAEQMAWLLSIMEEGEWYHPHLIAREYSGDEREYRYLRGAISGTLHEMLAEGKVERNESTEKGSMYRYRKVSR